MDKENMQLCWHQQLQHTQAVPIDKVIQHTYGSPLLSSLAPFSIPLVLIIVMGKLKPIPADFGRVAGNTLG